jgi:glyoxylase-like metal-dependent hydrolase (beta-lactamase superfamily II)/uncharacterized protein with ACT and thioredoxin-like domain
MRKISFIARMPDEPGALHRAAEIIKRYSGNINRLQYDRRIDPSTVFFEVTADKASHENIARELVAIGYLQTSIKPASHLKFFVDLPHRSGALEEFLMYTTQAGANIAYIDFNDAGKHPEHLTVSLNVEKSGTADALMDQLKSRYRMEISEYDNTGGHLDDTVFYVKFAQNVREIIGDTGDALLLSFLSDTNRIAQELADLGNDPRKVFESVLATGRTMRATTGAQFHADVQHVPVTKNVGLFCFQMPCGGNIFVFRTKKELVMVDSGYGIYHADISQLFLKYGLDVKEYLTRIIITHADADHCGGAGYFTVPSFMHHGTQQIIERNNRAYGSKSEGSILEEFYTKMINLFSRFSPPFKVSIFPSPARIKRGLFPVLGTVRIADLDLEVLESLGGHLFGQVYLYSAEHGLLFTADSIINFASLTPVRSAYNSLADFLVTSVNVDSELARKERKALFDLAVSADAALKAQKRRCLVCGGHGAVSVLDAEKLVPYGNIEHYTVM